MQRPSPRGRGRAFPRRLPASVRPARGRLAAVLPVPDQRPDDGGCAAPHEDAEGRHDGGRTVRAPGAECGQALPRAAASLARGSPLAPAPGDGCDRGGRLHPQPRLGGASQDRGGVPQRIDRDRDARGRVPRRLRGGRHARAHVRRELRHRHDDLCLHPGRPPQRCHGGRRLDDQPSSLVWRRCDRPDGQGDARTGEHRSAQGGGARDGERAPRPGPGRGRRQARGDLRGGRGRQRHDDVAPAGREPGVDRARPLRRDVHRGAGHPGRPARVLDAPTRLGGDLPVDRGLRRGRHRRGHRRDRARARPRDASARRRRHERGDRVWQRRALGGDRRAGGARRSKAARSSTGCAPPRERSRASC